MKKTVHFEAKHMGIW